MRDTRSNVIAIRLHRFNVWIEFVQSLFAEQLSGGFQCAQTMPRQNFEATASCRIMACVFPNRCGAHVRPGHQAIVEQCVPVLRLVELPTLIDDGLFEGGQVCGCPWICHTVRIFDESWHRHTFWNILFQLAQLLFHRFNVGHGQMSANLWLELWLLVDHILDDVYQLGMRQTFEHSGQRCGEIALRQRRFDDAQTFRLRCVKTERRLWTSRFARRCDWMIAIAGWWCRWNRCNCPVGQMKSFARRTAQCHCRRRFGWCAGVRRCRCFLWWPIDRDATTTSLTDHNCIAKKQNKKQKHK